MTVIIFIIVLAVLIFVHELGHFLVAIWNKIRVDEFKIGFGPKILSWGKGETKYGLNLIPFGGYVKIHGENPDEESIHGHDKDRSFVNKNPFQQVSVLVAGVAFNFLFAWLLYSIVFSFGVSATKEGFEKYQSLFSNERIMISSVSVGSPAENAGLKMGDVIHYVNKKENNKIEQIQNEIINSKGQSIVVGYERDGKILESKVLPKTGIVGDKYAIGIAMSDVVDIKLPIFTSIIEGGRYTLFMMKEMALGLYDFFSNLFRGQANFADVSGPIGIAGIVGGAASMGMTYLLMITALISINLGIINLIPFPALDGGRVLFVLIESISRRKIKPVIANWVNTVGFVLLMLLMIVVTYKDIVKILK
jgi:regulator of sigma E protease